MIRFLPVSSNELPKPYCSDTTLCGYVGCDMLNGEKECGFSVFRLNGYTMEIVDILSQGDSETVEGFIRSSLNYGANRGAYIAYYKTDKGIDVAKLLGFCKGKDGILTGEIPELLAGHCCKNNRK